MKFTAYNSRGYTLIELIIAVGLFAIIMTLASGAYLVMIGANRRAQALATATNNLSFVMESMTRSIRTGSNYSAGCGVTSFSFVDQNGQNVTYSLSNERILRNGEPITAPTVRVWRLGFCAVGLSTGDSNQKRVHLFLGGDVSAGPGVKQDFSLQSTVTMRGTDI
jgi:prepilin-type N-terminal cleavage/methylation domain-containing protein